MLLCFIQPVLGQGLIDSSKNVNLHFQQTVITQGHPAFKALYSGTNSLNTGQETETSVTATLYLGVKVMDGMEVYFDPELSGGSGVSGAVGLAGFSNGETFRIGSPKPALYPARLFAKYTLNMDDSNTELLKDDANQLETKQSKENIMFILGKFGIADYFDNNDYSHDPRLQFLNWSLMNSGAWDYPADTRGYTWGFTMMYNNPSYSIQFAGVMEPESANGLAMDSHINKSFGLALELDKYYSFFNKEGTARLLLFLNKARMGSYDEAVNATADSLNITMTRLYSREKFGFAFNISQKITDKTGGFLRASWNNGQTETWAFTEIDHSLAAGIVCSEVFSSLVEDELGAAFVVNGISREHRNYLAAGGYGFIIGDGKLNYANEFITELYYKLQLTKYISLTPDYQFVLNPAYNKDRGPVNLFAVRVHTEF
jgi:high affinity Mn2+ porin